MNNQPTIEVEKEGPIMDLELSYACNLACKGCFTSSCKKVGKMRFEEVKKIIKQAKEAGFKTVDLIGGGEPLLYWDSGKDIFDVIDLINEQGLAVEMFTNGLLVTKEIANKLSEKNVTVIVKLNSLNPEVCYKVTGDGKKESIEYLDSKNWTDYRYVRKSGEFKKENIPVWIKYLIDAYKKNKEAQIGIETVLFRENYDGIVGLWLFCRDNDIIPSFEVCARRGEGRAVDILSKEEVKELFFRIAEVDRKEYGFSWMPVPPYMGGNGCHLSGNIIYVKVDGGVQPCEGISVTIGNLIEGDKLNDIWNSNPILLSLRKVKESKENHCKNCCNKEKCVSPCMGAVFDEFRSLNGFPENKGLEFCWWKK